MGVKQIYLKEIIAQSAVLPLLLPGLVYICKQNSLYLEYTQTLCHWLLLPCKADLQGLRLTLLLCGETLLSEWDICVRRSNDTLSSL